MTSEPTTHNTTPPTTSLSPWLVRYLCENCNEEHYRYFNTEQTSEQIITRGQCRSCFDELQYTMLACNMIEKPLGQIAWYHNLSPNLARNTYSQSPAWRYQCDRTTRDSTVLLKIVTEIKNKIALARNK